MDIEGAELGVVRGALSFLKSCRRMRFVMETHRMRNGSNTETELVPMFKSAGYTVKTGKDQLGQRFLWAM
jgi:hypothetical protein